MAVFAVNGLQIGGYGAALPALRTRLGIDSAGVAVLLVVSGTAAVISMQVGGRLADRIGARVTTVASMPVLAAGMVGLALAPTMPVALGAAAVFGLGNGSMDVAMNTLGVRVEQARGGPVMSRLHAFFSIGHAVGAGVVFLVSLVVSSGGDLPGEAARVVVVALLLVAVAGVVGFLVAARAIPDPPPADRADGAPRGPIPPVAWLLAVMAVCFGISEGTAVDWSSIHVTDVVKLDPGAGAIGLVCVAGSMVLVRLLGDAVVARVGRRLVVQWGATTAVVGYLVVATTNALPLVLTGWCLVGLGVGLVAPQIYAAAGHLGGGRMLAVVVTFGYAAFLAGPAAVGAAVRAGGIQRAMVVPLAVAVVLAIVVRWLPDRTNRTDPADAAG